jgi:hypothetical protein
MKPLSNSVYLALTFSVLTACSAKVTGGSADPAPAFGTDVPAEYKDQVEGLNLDGSYTSACVQDIFSDGGRIIHWSIEGRNLTRKIESFKDAVCKTSPKTDDSTAVFRFLKKFPQDVYEIEWMYTGKTFGNGGDGVKLEGDHLLIGDGDSSGKVPKLRLNRDGAPVGANPTSISPAALANSTSGNDFVPSIGDSVEYEGTSKQIFKVQGIDPYDSSWELSIEMNGGSGDVSHSMTLFSSADYRAKLAACSKVETIVTKAGAFVTCREDDGSDTRWYGNIPIFGLVKVQSHDGSYHLELTKYSIGQAKK